MNRSDNKTPHVGLRETSTIEIIAYSVGYVALNGICIILMLVAIYLLNRRAKRLESKEYRRNEENNNK